MLGDADVTKWLSLVAIWKLKETSSNMYVD